MILPPSRARPLGCALFSYSNFQILTQPAEDVKAFYKQQKTAVLKHSRISCPLSPIVSKNFLGAVGDNDLLVPEMGLEPIWISPFDFKSNAYTNSAIRAYFKHSYMTLYNHLQSQPTCCKDCCNFCCRLTITQMSMFCHYYTTKVKEK